MRETSEKRPEPADLKESSNITLQYNSVQTNVSVLTLMMMVVKYDWLW